MIKLQSMLQISINEICNSISLFIKDKIYILKVKWTYCFAFYTLKMYSFIFCAVIVKEKRVVMPLRAYKAEDFI